MAPRIASAALLFLAIQTSLAAELPSGWNFAFYTNIPSAIEDAYLPSGKEGGAAKILTTGVETEITDEILALAQALQNDPVRIYEYVRDHIRYEPTFGQRKGAQGTLLSGSGNDLDQCALLIALLNAADPSSDAQFVKAQVDYTPSFLGKLCDIPASVAGPTLYNLGVPASAAGSNIRVVHFWVEATIDGQTNVLDPAFVQCQRVTGATLPSLLGYNRNTFMANATNGAMIGTNYIEDVNYANITNDLRSFTTNVLTEIQQNYPSATVGEFLGETRNIEPPITTLPTNLPHAVQIVDGTRVEYAEIPSNLHAKVTINHRGIVRTLKACTIAGKRLSIRYVGGSKYATLMIDGETDTTGSSTTQGHRYDCTLTLSTPYQLSTLSGTHLHKLTSGESYAVLADFGVVTPRVLQRFREQISRARADGASDTSEAVLCGSLNLIGHRWAQECRLSNYVAGKVIGALGNSILRGGIIRQEDRYGIDIAIDVYRGYYLTGALAEILSTFQTSGLMGSAFEHAIFEQTQGGDKPAVSTVKLLWKGNGDGHRTYLADSANWSTVQEQLQGYDDSVIDAISNWLSSGCKVMLPRRGDHAIGDWEGAGYLAYNPGENFQIAYVIADDLNGGAGGCVGDLDIGTVIQGLNLTTEGSSFDYNPTFGADPVDLFTGNMAHSKRFLALGSEPPRGLGLSGLYNSGQSDQKSTLGYGWRHSLDIAATRISNPEPSVGLRQPADLVPLIVSCVVVGDLLKNEFNLKGYLISSLVTKWQADQMTDNTVAVRMGNRTLEFVKMPDGSFNPPTGITADLIQTNGQYRLLKRYGTEYRFNSDGHLGSIVDADGKSLNFSYNAQTNLQIVTDAYSRTLTFSYSGAKVSVVSDSTGRSVSFGYTDDDLTTFTDPDGKVWTYQYNDDHRVVATRDPLSQVTVSNIYSAVGQVVTQYNGHGEAWTFHISGPWGVEVDPEGGETTHYFDALGQNLGTEDALGNRTYNYYNGQGLLVSNVDARGYATLYQYDSQHNLTNRTDALSNTHSFTYDNDNRLAAETDPLGNTTTYGYDDTHHVTYMVDALTNETVRTYYTSGSHAGLLHTVTDPEGNVTTYTYGTYENPYIVTRTDGGTVTNTWNACGDLLTRADANGNETTFTYNNRRLLTSFTDPLGNTTSNVYNDAGLKTTVIDPLEGETVTAWTPTYKVESVTYPDGSVVSNVYNSRDWLVAVVDPRDNVSSNIYDAAGRQIAVVDANGERTAFALDANGNVTARTNALGKVTSFVYDKLNRLVLTTDPLNHSVSNTWDAASRLTAITDELGYTTELQYDACGLRTHRIKPDGVTEIWEYDDNGALTVCRNGLGQPFTFHRDGQGRVTNTVDAVGNARSFIFDPVGNLTTLIDADASEIAFTYDDADRLTLIEYPNSNTVSFGYNALGLRTNMTDWTGSVAYQYDAMHRLTNAVVVSYGVTSTVAYAYDSNGNRIETALAGKLSVDYDFDPANRLTNTAFSVLSSPVRRIAYHRDALGFATNAVYPNGATATWTRDDASRLTGLSHHSGTSNFIDRAYTLDAHGNVTAMEINAGLLPQVTDQIKRLKQNAADELTSIQTKTNPGEQNWTDKTPVHDDEGNLTSDGDKAYGYDYENRLVSAVTATATVTHAYSGDGNRVFDQTVTLGNTNLHYYVVDLADPLKRPLAILDADGDLVRAFIWGRGAVAQVEADGSVYYFHQDGQGSTLALSDTNAVVTDQWFYSPYGQVMNRTGSTATPYQWIGGAGVFAESYGLYHMHARHYHPELHRFMSRDPLGIAGGGNLYAYAALNPLLFYDPYGLSPSTWDNIINGAVYGDFAADTGWGGVGSQVVIGVIPVLGQIADFRDTIANIGHVWNDPTSGSAWLGLGAAVVSWVPGLDFAKGTVRAGREIATEVGQSAFRNADEVGQAVVRGANDVVPTRLYHYTSSEAADRITSQGLRTGRDGFVYSTPSSDLSPVQAQIELALPGNRAAPDAVFQIDTEGLGSVGIDPTMGPRRVQGNLPGMGAGGGTEVLFDQDIPPEYIERIR